MVRSFKNEAHAWTNLCIEGLKFKTTNMLSLLIFSVYRTEPFDLTNTARSCYDEEIFKRIKSVFVTSWHMLRDTMNLDALFDKPFLTPPATIPFDNLPVGPTYPPVMAQFT